VKLATCTDNELDQVFLLGVVALQKQTEYLRNVKFEISPQPCPHIRIDTTYTQLSHRCLIARVQFNESGDRVYIVLPVAHLLTVLADVRQPPCERTHEVRLICFELLLAATQTTTKEVVRDATQAPASFYDDK